MKFPDSAAEKTILAGALSSLPVLFLHPASGGGGGSEEGWGGEEGEGFGVSECEASLIAFGRPQRGDGSATRL